MSRAQSQKAQVLDHLQAGWTITPLEALRKFGAMRLSAIIFDLKADGYCIKTELVRDGDKHYARYELVTEPRLF